MRFFLLLIFSFAYITEVSCVEFEKLVESSIDVDKAEEARPVLLHLAVLDLLENLSAELNYDFKSFNHKALELFNQRFPPLNSKTQNVNRDEEFRDFLNLVQLLESHHFKSINKDPGGPWKAELSLNVNKEKIKRFVKRIFSEEKSFSKLLILTDIDLHSFSWSDMGLETPESLTLPLTSSWAKLLHTSLPINLDEVVACTGVCKEDFHRWLQLSRSETPNTSQLLRDGLWLKLSFNLRRLHFQPLIQKWSVSWSGSAILLDANTKKILASYDLPLETRSLRGLNQKTLNSSIASSMYKTGVDALRKVKNDISLVKNYTRPSLLTIKGHRQVHDLISLMDLIRDKSVNLQLEVQLETLGTKEAQVRCFHHGEEKSFMDLLSRLKELKSSHNYKIVNELTDVGHVLKLVAQ